MSRRPGRPPRPISREELLGAAARVFDRDGYGAATLSDVAREAGITKGALFYHYSAKEALYDELLSEITATFGAHLLTALQPGAPWPARLDALGEAVVRELGARPHVARLMLRELVDGGPFVARSGREGLSQLAALVVAFLDEGAALGLLQPQDTRHLAGTIVSLHLAWFGARALPLALGEGDEGEIERRVREVRAQVRRLCGLSAARP
jgi:AcrR family transcriptional regulator